MSYVSSALAPSCTSQPAHLPQHVFLIVLENEGFDETFGKNAPDDSYLKQLALGKKDREADQAVLLDNYYAVGHNSLDNYIAMISGQPPNPATQIDCPYFVEMIEHDELHGEARQKVKDRIRSFFHFHPDNDDNAVAGVDMGVGCVYPSGIPTVADQFQANNLSWRAYMEDMQGSCAHPLKEGDRDKTHQSIFKQILHQADTNKYATRHNPFVYFHSLIDEGGHGEKSRCDQNDGPLGDIDGTTDGLVKDLNNRKPFPNFVFISPNLCNDGHNACDNVPKMREINDFLERWVEKIRASQVYNKEDGMIIITFDEAEVSTDKIDLQEFAKNKAASTACCNEALGPFSEHPGIFGPGGGKIGAVIISPLVQPGAQTNSNEFNHYSMLRSVEEMFGIHKHLGYANDDHLHTFQECGVFKAD